jgi:hypothetical protein
MEQIGKIVNVNNEEELSDESKAYSDFLITSFKQKIKEKKLENEVFESEVFKLKTSTSKEKKEERESVNGSDTWKVNCCNDHKIDSRLLVFIVNVAISLITLILSFIKLFSNDLNESDKSTYISLISLVVGIWIKSPISH